MYEDREATPSELAFFLANPNIGGYASFDTNNVVHNPFNQFTPEQREGIRINEGTRLFLNEYPSLAPNYDLTPYQEMQFKNYGNNIQDKKNTVAGRYFSNDKSIGVPSTQQVNELEQLRKYIKMLKDKPEQTTNIFDSYKTPLNTTDELAYQLAKNDSPFKYDNGYDYDLRGFWKKYGSLQQQATNGHLTDEYKLPWHETFSTQSKFYNGQPWAINPYGYRYLPDRFDLEVVQNGLKPWGLTIYDN